ncbi:hypothetical protein FHS18_000872 [Paenibacillus phyllosphaerae]|uniref:Uncharacterized protein n=1 Tax=Paenibacillus phyllosphaerae TaxID=274593 RepID=A0A7W5FL43_9BACL|nr:hypothetical protein [Paenibacillus phyllosphaerae]MBB3108820.1 hypothetical protein [Paenibacillus phyllosphaerae]
MSKQTQPKNSHTYSYMTLQNNNPGATFPVAVDYSFLQELFGIERSYGTDQAMLFRRNSHPLRKFHVTEMSLRLMMTIFRRFNTEGSLVGVSIHRLYQLMNEEYEDAGSKEQFYAEVRKFIDLKLISTTRSGIISQWRLEAFKRGTGRFVLFHPVVFTKAFTDLPLSAQKLYLYIMSRNGQKTNTPFKEFLGEDSWLYTFTHKSRPAQVRELLHSLEALKPVAEASLLNEADVAKDDLGRWYLRCVPNAAYVIRHQTGHHYRSIPKAKVPYSRTVGRLRMLLHTFRIGEIEFMEHGQLFLRLAQLLHNNGFKTLRFAVGRLRELFQSGQIFASDPVAVLEAELADRGFVQFIEVAKATGVYPFILGEEADVFGQARPVQFYRAIRERFSLRRFAAVCRRALPLLRSGEAEGAAREGEDFYLEDYLLARFAQ